MTPFETVEVICKEVIIVREHIVPVCWLMFIRCEKRVNRV
jgi:hypothetical protein